MIIDTETDESTELLQQLAASRGEMMGNAFDEGLSNNVGAKLYQWLQAKTASGSHFTKEEVEEFAKGFNVRLKNIPDDGMNEEAVKVLVERQYQKRIREDAIASSSHGVASKTLEIGAEFAAGLLDPINLAVSLIPFAGQARSAAWLAGAGNVFSRTAARAGIGAINGAGGAVVLEPFQYILSEELQDDYTLTNSLMNVALGAGIGATLHAGGGLLHDTYKGTKKKISDVVTEWSADTRLNALRAAVGQVAEDRNINVEPIVKSEELALRNKIKALEAEAKLKPNERGAIQDEINHFESQRENPSRRLSVHDVLSQEGPLDVVLNGEATQLERTPEGEFQTPTGETFTLEELVKKIDDGEMKFASPEEMSSSSLESEAPATVEDIASELDEASTPPNEMFFNEDLSEAQLQELRDAPKEMTYEQAQLEVQDAVAQLEELAKEAGLDAESLLREANKEVKKSVETGKGLTAMALCLLKKGL